jgi:hypothetical protein
MASARRRPEYRGERAQLQRQAFAEIARAHTGRIERLHELEHALHFRGVGRDFGQQRVRDFVERLGDVAIVLDRIDDGACDREFSRREIGVFELTDEVILQREGDVVGDFGGALMSSRQESEPALRSVQLSSMTSASTVTSGAGVASTRFSSGIGCGSRDSKLPVASYSSTGSSITLLSSCSRMCACSSMAGICRRRIELLQLRGHGQCLTQLQLQ